MQEAGSSSEFGAGFDAHADAPSGASSADRGAHHTGGAERGATSGAFSAEMLHAPDAEAEIGRGAGLVPVPTAPVVPAQRGVRDAARGEVLLRHARLASSGGRSSARRAAPS